MLYNIDRFHFLALITWQFAIFFAGQNIFGIFSNYVPSWKCDNVGFTFFMMIVGFFWFLGTFQTGNGPITKNCDIYLSCAKKNLTFINPAFNSAAMEFDWICGRSAYNQSFFSQIQYFGVLLGTVFFGTLSDTFGRKPIGASVILLAFLMTFSTGLATSRHILFGIRFFVGLATGGILAVLCTWVMEVLLPEQRMVLRGVFNWGWTRIFLTLICYLFPEWRTASFVCAACTIPALLLVVFVIPESPTWLHNKGRKLQMIHSEIRMAKLSGRHYVPVEHEPVTKSLSIFEALKTKGMFKKLLVLWIMWFIASICAYANDLNSNKLSGDLYINQVLFGIVLVFSKLLLLLIDTKFENFKRRTLHQGAQFCTIICFVTLASLMILDYHGYATLIINLLGTVFIEYTWDACYLCAIESMETTFRASATGTCSSMARVGAILAPFLNYANNWWSPAVYVTVVILGTFNLFLSYFFLQETKNVDLDKVHTDEQDEKLELDVRHNPLEFVHNCE